MVTTESNCELVSGRRADGSFSGRPEPLTSSKMIESGATIQKIDLETQILTEHTWSPQERKGTGTQTVSDGSTACDEDDRHLQLVVGET